MKALAIIELDENYELEEGYTVEAALRDGQLDIAYDIVYERKEIDVLGGFTVELKPMPEKRMPKPNEAFHQSMTLIDRWRGFDECIDEILGEEYESNISN